MLECRIVREREMVYVVYVLSGMLLTLPLAEGLKSQVGGCAKEALDHVSWDSRRVAKVLPGREVMLAAIVANTREVIL